MSKKYKERIELHCHSKYSKMDATASPEEILRFAYKQGMPAVAVADQSSILAYPELAWTYKSKKNLVRPIYGVGVSILDDVKKIVRSDLDLSYDDEFVVFEFKTTGSSRKTDQIIEIAAVKIKAREIRDSFHMFVKPKPEINGHKMDIKGIDDEQATDGPGIDNVLPDFLDFVGDAVVIVYDSEFDMGFLNAAKKMLGIKKELSSIDTQGLCRYLAPELLRHTLGTVCTHLGISLEPNCTLQERVIATARVAVRLFDMLEDRNIPLPDVNTIVRGNIGYVKRMPSFRATILIKNEIGRKNLFKLITESELTYKGMHPKIPLSLLIEHREGLLIGSGCDNGMLYRILFGGAEESELLEEASIFDYIEIVPAEHFQYMIGDNCSKINSMEELRGINQKLVSAAKQAKVPAVAVGEPHYLDEVGRLARDILLNHRRYESDYSTDLHFQTTDEMLACFEYLGKEKAYEIVVENTNKIAEMCVINNILPDRKLYPVIENADETLRQLCKEEIEYRYYGDDRDRADERLNWELSKLWKHDTLEFLVIHELLDKMGLKACDIVTEWNAGNSIVAFLLGMTECDPLKHGLYPEMVFGKEGGLCQGISFVSLPSHRLKEAYRIAGQITNAGVACKEGNVCTVSGSMAESFVREYCEDKNVSFSENERENIKERITGVLVSVGQDSDGIVIVPADEDINEITPLARSDRSGTVNTVFDCRFTLSSLLRLDISSLGLTDLLSGLSEYTGIALEDVPYDDKEVIRFFVTSRMVGDTFWYGEPLWYDMSLLCHLYITLKPASFEDIMKVEGLMRSKEAWDENLERLVADGKIELKDLIVTRDDVMDMCIEAGIDRKKAFRIAQTVRRGARVYKEDSAKWALVDEWEDWEAMLKKGGVPEWKIDCCKQIRYLSSRSRCFTYAAAYLRAAWFKLYLPKAYDEYLWRH